MATKIVGALETAAAKMNTGLHYLCMAMLFIMMVVGTADVVGRYIFNRPVWGTFENFGILLAAIVLLGLSYAQADRSHVTVDLLVGRLKERAKAAFGIFTTIIALSVAVLILWQGLTTSLEMRELGLRIQTIGLPIWFPLLLVPTGALALAYILLIQLLQYILVLGKRS